MSTIQQLIQALNFETFDDLQVYFEKLNIDVKVDSISNRYMLWYIENKSDLKLKWVRECSGIVFEKVKPFTNILHYSFPKCYIGFKMAGYKDEKKDVYTSKISTITADISPFNDGSMIKLYFHNDIWNIGTSKIFDAKFNKWSSKKSFYELFCECIKSVWGKDYTEFTDSLDKEYFYTYIFQHPEHKVNLKTLTSMVFLVNRVNKDLLKEEVFDQEKYITDKTIKEILKTQKRSHHGTDNYLAYIKENNEIIDRVQMLSPSYHNIKRVNGNSSNIGLRYLESMTDTNTITELRANNADKIKMFDKIDELFVNACGEIFQWYTDAKIKRTNTDIPELYDRTVYQLHSQYHSTRKPITMDDISNKLYTFNPRLLAKIIGFRY